MYDIKSIRRSYKLFKNDPNRKNYKNFKTIAAGDSASVFLSDVISRVKLEYMGVVNDSGSYNEFMPEWDNEKNCVALKSTPKPFKNLVVGNSTLKDSTRLYAEIATSKRINVTTANEQEEKFMDQFNLNEELADVMTVQSWGGKCLLKPALDGEEISLSVIEPGEYFPIISTVNNKKHEGYCIVTCNKEDNNNYVYLEIYTKNGVEYRKYKEVTSDLVLEEVPNDDIFSDPDYGLVKTEDDLGYRDPEIDFLSVFEVNNIFDKTDYDPDTMANLREIIVGDTLTSQAFDKVANPLMQVPDSMLEYTTSGKYKVRFHDRIVTLKPNDKEVKQIALETKTAEWLLSKEKYLQKIYNSLGVNEVAFGNLQTGASGEALRRGLERTIATVEAKRDKALKALENVLVAAYKMVYKKDMQLSLKGEDLLTLGMDIKSDIAIKCVAGGIMSLETALKFLNLQDVEIEQEIEKIKSSVDYKTKLANILNVVGNVGDTAELQKIGENLSAEIIKELGLA